MQNEMLENWDDLRLFLAVARHQSLTAAGRSLRLDPATMGRRVARLEATLGIALFRKSPRGYDLTEAGTALLSRAETAEEAMRAAAIALGKQDAGLSGQIRIGAPDGCANYLLPQVCNRLATANPGLDIQIVALPRVFNLSRREADIAIGVSAPTAGRLLVQRITGYHLHLAASESYLAANPPIRSVSDLHEHRLVGYIPDMIYDAELDYLADLGAARVRLASNSVAVQLNILAQGGGVGVVHDFALAATPNVRRVLTDEVSLRRSFFMIRHAADRNDQRLTRFAAELADGLRQEVSRREQVTKAQAFS